MKEKDYIAIVQCHLVKQRCSGYGCESAFHQRSDGFAGYSPDKGYRTLYLTCGGCCGGALQRKLNHLARKLKAREKIEKDQIVVQLSSCITKESYHGPACPHLDYLKKLIGNVGLDICEGTRISQISEQHRKSGVYAN